MELEIVVTQHLDAQLLVLLGELDVLTAPKLREAFLKVYGQSPETIVIDVRALDFLDSTGLDLFVAFFRRARLAHKRLCFIIGHGPAARIFRITGYDRAFEIIGDMSDLNR
jgi:anti-sigma B factor antagonist